MIVMEVGVMIRGGWKAFRMMQNNRFRMSVLEINRESEGWKYDGDKNAG